MNSEIITQGQRGHINSFPLPAPVRYQVFQLDRTRDGFKRTLLGACRFYTDAYIILRSCQDSDPDGNYWIHDVA